MNKESKRETPAVVSFGDKMRFIGTDGAAKWPMNVPNTAYQVQRLLGKQFRDPTVQQDIAKLPFKVSEGPNGGCLVELLFCNELHTFTPEQLTAMLLVDLKRIAEVEAGVPVNDCCISVPTYFTEAERYAMLAAAQVAGLNCLQLVNETTATALAYGIFKTDLADEAVNVAFVIVGQASTQVSIAAVKKSGLQIRSHAWDRALGGRDFDELLFDHFADEFKAKTKADVRGNKKACFKLRVACEKLKKVLSANAEAPISVECLVDEIDMRGTMTRDKFEEMAAPLTARIRATTESALKLSGLAAQDVASIEIVGSSTRMPAIFRCVEEVFGRAPSRTLNSKEVMSRGCALKCAMISPVIKVRDYDVIDAAPYPVQFTWDKDGAPASQVLFDKFNPIPSTKMLTFMRSAPFTITAQYAEDGDLPAAAPRKIGEVSVGPFSVPAGAEKAKLKVKVQLNLNGLISVEGVTMVEEQEVAAEAAADAAAQKDVSMADAGGEAAPAADGDAAAAAAADVPMADAAAAPKAAEKKVRTIKHDVPFTAAAANALSPKQVADLHEKEVAMQAADRLQEETNDRKNALEAYIYAMRNKLHDGLAPYAKVRGALLPHLCADRAARAARVWMERLLPPSFCSTAAFFSFFFFFPRRRCLLLAHSSAFIVVLPAAFSLGRFISRPLPPPPPLPPSPSPLT